MHFSSKVVLHKICIDSLKELGAEVMDIEGIMFYIKFELSSGLSVNYIYHRNPDNTYLLERINPYRIVIGTYESEQTVVDNIKSDTDQLSNATQSHNFDKFVTVMSDMIKVIRNFDDLFLYYNVSPKELDYIGDSSKELLQALYRIKDQSDRVYYKTEPQSLKD